MDSDDQLLKILENSACLSKSQVLGYIQHTLYPEELRAVELHLSSCMLCSDAIDGLQAEADVHNLLSGLPVPVLPAAPVREKNTETPSSSLKAEKNTTKETRVPAKEDNTFIKDTRQKKKSHWPRNVAVAAVLLLGFSILWYIEFRPKENESPAIAQVLPETDSSLKDMAPVRENKAVQKAKATTTTDTAYRKIAQVNPGSQNNKDSGRKAKAAEPAPAGQLAQNKTDSGAATEKKAAAERQPVAMMATVPKQEIKEEEKNTEKKKDSNVSDSEADSESAVKDAKNPKENNLDDFNSGMKLYQQKQYASALLYFQAVESDKSNSRYWDAVYYSALCNKYLNKTRRAKKLFERIVSENAPNKKAAQKELDNMQK